MCCHCRALLCCVVVSVGFTSKCQGSEALQQLSIPCTLKGFFSLCWNLIFHGCQSTVSMVFSSALTEKVLSSLKSRAKTYKKFLMMKKAFPIISSEAYNPCFCFVDVRDYNVKTMWSSCAKWNYSQNTHSLCKCFQVFLFIWLHEDTGAVGKLPRSINSKKFFSEWELFFWTWKGDRSYRINIARMAQMRTCSSECLRKEERIFSRPTQEKPWTPVNDIYQRTGFNQEKNSLRVRVSGNCCKIVTQWKLTVRPIAK